jgi:hypothetical protein
MQRPAGAAPELAGAAASVGAVGDGEGAVSDDGSLGREGAGSSTGRSQAPISSAAPSIAAQERGAIEKSWGRPRIPGSYHDGRRGGALATNLTPGASGRKTSPP